MTRYTTSQFSIARRQRRRLVAVGLTVMALLTLAACGNSSGEKANAEGLVEVSLATVPISGIAPGAIAQDDGLFKSQDLTMKADYLRFTPDIVAAVVGGSDDFGFINVVTLLQGLARNVPIRVVAPGYAGNPAEQGLYVKKGSPIKSFADLENKRIAVAGLKNIQQLGVMATGKAAGADPTTFEFVEVPVPNMAAAVESGQVDAIATTEPFITLAGDGLTEVVDDVYQAFGETPIVAYYVTSTKYAKQNADVVERFGSAIVDALEVARGDDDRVRKAVGTYAEIPPEVLSSMALPAFTTNLGIDNVRQIAEHMIEFGFIDEMPDNIDALFESAEGES